MGILIATCIDANMAGSFAYLVEKENNAQGGVLGVQILYNPFLSESVTVYLVLLLGVYPVSVQLNTPISYLIHNNNPVRLLGLRENNWLNMPSHFSR